MEYEQLNFFDLIEPPKKNFEKTAEQKIFDNIVKNEILKGSGFADGKKRIIEWFSSGLSDVELANRLKNEYGQGGWTITWKGKTIGHNSHGSDGIDIRLNEPMGRISALHIGYPMLVKDIRKYIMTGEYTEKPADVTDGGYIAPCPYTDNCNTYGFGCNGGTYWCGRYKKVQNEN